MYGKFTAMVSWAQIISFSEMFLNQGKDGGACE
jgi:hypothetical protein